MNQKDISQAKNPDLRHSVAAMHRAAAAARETAIRTGTHLVVRRNGQLVRIPAAELQAEEAQKPA
tara:strand:- start:13958 stop:14152 length:195 start_codon:yes stop_codon:yes gene_type:complete